MNSVLEAIFCGKPMVTIPLFVDQALNAKNMKRRGLAVVVEKDELDKDTLIAAIRQTLPANSSYALKAAKVAKYLRGRPDAARAEIVRWVKLVAEEGRMDHLVLASRDMSFIQYFCLDIIAYLLAQFLVTLFLIYRVLKFVYLRCRISIVKRKTE
ncbi:hypothetical protein NECAME_09792 [Necator americanus]|uniref:glucuronosyltransferase n=1 Tax=Necator americanus TaxID=51031 RepID=W2TE34_NECAM|nr:hypothetical protein NECAME_09792 [Necator americanus]ETN79456.1 hypothetical protein NECAME_09792 [Necator americanus]